MSGQQFRFKLGAMILKHDNKFVCMFRRVCSLVPYVFSVHVSCDHRKGERGGRGVAELDRRIGGGVAAAHIY